MADESNYTYGGQNERVSDPANSGLAVDLSAADVTLADPARALYVGTSGDIIMRGSGDAVDVTYKTVPVGVFPFRAKIIRKVGTHRGQHRRALLMRLGLPTLGVNRRGGGAGGVASGVFLFGNNAAPVSNAQCNADLAMGGAFQALSGGTIGSIVLRGPPTGGSSINFYVAVYGATSESVWGGAKLGQSAIQNGIAALQVKSIPLLLPVTYAAGWYALVVVAETNMDVGVAASSSTFRYFADTYADGPAATAGASALAGANAPSIYATT